MDAATPLFSYDRAAPKLVPVGDASIAVRCFGTGPEVLLVHGFPLHGYTWRYLLPALAMRHRCWAVDLPGFGDAQWSGATDFGFSAHAGRLARLLAELNLDRVSVVAQDTGATIARLLALAEPGRVTHLALINTEIPGHRPPWIREFQLSTYLPGSRLAFRMLLGSRAFRRSSVGYGGVFKDPARLDGDFHERFVAPLLREPHRLDGALRYLRGVDWNAVDLLASRHRDIRAKVVLLWGQDDRTFPVERAETMCGQFAPPCPLHRIRNARLLPHEEQPAQVLQHLVQFLD